MPANPNAPLEAFQHRLDLDSQQDAREQLTSRISVPGMSGAAMLAELGILGSGNFHREAAPSLDQLEGADDPVSFE